MRNAFVLNSGTAVEETGVELQNTSSKYLKICQQIFQVRRL